MNKVATVPETVKLQLFLFIIKQYIASGDSYGWSVTMSKMRPCRAAGVLHLHSPNIGQRAFAFRGRRRGHAFLISKTERSE